MKNSEEVKFAVGDKVKWFSQAGGRGTWKHGVIVRVIGAKEEVCEGAHFDFVADLRASGKAIFATDLSAIARSKQSYFVLVPPPYGTKQSAKLYWPVTSKLEPEKDAPLAE